MALENRMERMFSEVVTSGLCTGCAPCVIACPTRCSTTRPTTASTSLHSTSTADEDCTTDKGLHDVHEGLSRFVMGAEIDTHSSRANEPGRVSGIATLWRAPPTSPRENGQDGGFVSALLIYALENDVIDAALVSVSRATARRGAVPSGALARGRDRDREVALHYVPSAAYPEAPKRRRSTRFVGWAAGSAPGAMRRARPASSRDASVSDCSCVKTFDD